jgi:hypothetical protein
MGMNTYKTKLAIKINRFFFMIDKKIILLSFTECENYFVFKSNIIIFKDRIIK